VIKFHKIVRGDYFKMVKPFAKCRWLLPTALLLTLVLALIPIPVFANPGMTVSNALVLANVAPGQTLNQTMTVSIGSNDPATTISVQVYGVQQSPQGGYILLNASEDTGPYSARPFVSVDSSSFHLEPGGSHDLTITIQIPQDVGDGGRYAMVNIATQPVAGAGVNIITAVNVPVYLTIQGSRLIQQGKITALNASEVTSGRPVNISATFQNTGNHHFKVEGLVTVTNDQGQIVGNVSIPVTSSSLLPGALRQMKAAFIPNGDLAQGIYTVNSQVMLEDGTMLDEANTTFEVKTAYKLPTAMGKITLTPSSAATLASTDGSISIYFPQGAAIAPVEISINTYPADQLPSLPAGMTLAGTCFKVDGLTGLLAKEATVSMKYTTDDLGKAGGDASRLRLARCDNNQWTVLKTNVNEGAMMLSANSNQMSVWAVLVGSPAAANASWTTLAAIVGVIVLALVAVAIIFLARRRRQV
jgi:hypothetical protein